MFLPKAKKRPTPRTPPTLCGGAPPKTSGTPCVHDGAGALRPDPRRLRHGVGVVHRRRQLPSPIWSGDSGEKNKYTKNVRSVRNRNENRKEPGRWSPRKPQVMGFPGVVPTFPTKHQQEKKSLMLTTDFCPNPWVTCGNS